MTEPTRSDAAPAPSWRAVHQLPPHAALGGPAVQGALTTLFGREIAEALRRRGLLDGPTDPAQAGRK